MKKLILFSSFMSLLQIPRECVRYTALKDASSPGLALWENLLLSFSVFILHTPNQAVSKTVLLTDCIEVFVDVIKYAPAKVCIFNFAQRTTRISSYKQLHFIFRPP